MGTFLLTIPAHCQADGVFKPENKFGTGCPDARIITFWESSVVLAEITTSGRFQPNPFSHLPAVVLFPLIAIDQIVLGQLAVDCDRLAAQPVSASTAALDQLIGTIKETDFVLVGELPSQLQAESVTPVIMEKDFHLSFITRGLMDFAGFP